MGRASSLYGKVERGMRPYYEHGGITIYHGDCREMLLGLSADLLLTDPPYGINYSHRRWSAPSTSRVAGGIYGKRSEPMVGDETPFDPSTLLRFPALILWGAHCYASRLPDSAGWLVWDKKRWGVVAEGLTASAVDLAWTNLCGHTKVFSHLWDGFRRDSEGGEFLHPTQKPVALMAWCLSLAPEAKVILDPYCGSGPVLRAAKEMGRCAIGIEIEEKYCEIAARRLEQEVLPLESA